MSSSQEQWGVGGNGTTEEDPEEGVFLQVDGENVVDGDVVADLGEAPLASNPPAPCPKPTASSRVTRVFGTFPATDTAPGPENPEGATRGARPCSPPPDPRGRPRRAPQTGTPPPPRTRTPRTTR